MNNSKDTLGVLIINHSFTSFQYDKAIIETGYELKIKRNEPNSLRKEARALGQLD